MRRDDTKQKSSSSIKLPKMSPAVRLILIIGIFLVIAIPLFLIYSQQQPRQAEVNHQYSMLQKVLGKQEDPETLKKGLDEEIEKDKKELDAVKATFPITDRSPEIIDGLLALAKSNGIEITKTLVTNTQSSIEVGTDIMIYPVLVFNVSLKGQVPKFQNFLLELNTKYPTSELQKVYFRIPEVEEEEDTAEVVLNVYSSELPESMDTSISVVGEKLVVTFTDKEDKTTDLFKIENSKWRIDWKATASNAKWSGLDLIIYRKDETGRYVEIISQTGGNPEGTSYVYEGEGDFYIKVITANISDWEIKVFE